MPGIPVVIASNGKGIPVKQVTSGAPVMTVATNGLGIPIVLSDLGSPFVVQGGSATVPSISVSSGSGYAGSTYSVINGGTGNWQSNGVNISGQTSTNFVMTLALEGSVITWLRSDSVISNGIRMRIPQDVAGIVSLFDIRQGLVQSSGSVSAWNSQVGGVSGTQAVGSRQPTYSPTSFAGSPGLTIAATQALNNISVNTGPDARTYVGAVIFNVAGTNSIVDGTATSNYVLRRTSGGILQAVRKGVSPAYQAMQTVPDNSPLIISFRHGNGTWSIDSNGMDVGSGNIANPAFSTGGTASISNEAAALVGVSSSQVMYDASLVNSDLYMVQGWIAHTLGQSAILPVGHPYKDGSSMRVIS